MLSRRSFIKALAAMGGTLLLPLGRVAGGRIAQVAQAQASPDGELYEGFVLLPEGAPRPSFVKPAKYGIPRFGDDTPGAGPILTKFLSAEELARRIRLPVYTLAHLPDGMQPNGAVLVQHTTGEVYGAWVTFMSYSRELQCMVCTADVWMQPDFMQPLPLLLPRALLAANPQAVQKVAGLPSPGVAFRGHRGTIFHWIRQGVYYRLRVEHGPASAQGDALAAALMAVG